MYALNAMVIADANRLIRGLDCLWPGCTHDARLVTVILPEVKGILQL